MEPMKPMEPMRPMEPMKPMVFDQWWPKELGQPSTAGAQNGIRYAVFPDKRRLLVERAGRLTTYDTGEHRIGGVSSQQQNGGEASLMFSSQHGPVRLEQLPVENEQPRQHDHAAEAGGSADARPLHHQHHTHPHDQRGRDSSHDDRPLAPPPHDMRASDHPVLDHRGADSGRDDRRGAGRDFPLQAGERVVFSEEGARASAVKLVVAGEIDVDMIEAVEDYLRRQKRRLTRG